MKILHLSDTHTFHDYLKPEPVDLIIHSGDCSNQRDAILNQPEVMRFLNWYAVQDAKYKVYVPGNHDTSIEKGLVSRKEFTDRGITLLIDESVTIEGLKIYGSPWTPDFGFGWAWNKDRSKLHDVWEQIPVDTDIIVTHGPPKGMLDLAQNYLKASNGEKQYTGEFDSAGCRALATRIQRIKPLFSMFGHIHNNNGIQNAGTRTISSLHTVFSNAAVMTDAKFSLGPTSQGNLFTI